jgi:hypothetical protein
VSQGRRKASPGRRRRRSRAKLPPQEEPRRLPQLAVQASVVDDTLYLAWDDHAEADSWRVVVRGADRRVRRVLTLPEDEIATQVKRLPTEFAPYAVQVFARRRGELLAVGRAQGISWGA